MSKLRHIIRLHSQGLGKKKIALRLSVSKNTVKHYIDYLQTIKTTYDEIEKLTELELNNLFHPPRQKPLCERLEQLYAHFPDVEKQMRRKGMTLLKLFKKYKELYPGGYSETQFYGYYRLWSKKVMPSMVIPHKEGDKIYVDYAGTKLPYACEVTGEIKQAEVFVAILGWSQYTYVEAVESQTLEDFIACSENAFHYFKGVPEAIVPDNLKSAVFKACRYEPQLNENFAAFANHYRTSILPTRARMPQDKALVEGMVNITYQRIYSSLPENKIFTLKELNAQIQIHLRNHNNTPLTGKNCSRTDQWILELPSLGTLPQMRYQMRKIKQVTVMKNGHVYLSEDQHYYSVPYELIGKKIIMQYSHSQVELFVNYQLIASHKRVRSPHNYSTEPSHMPPAHRYVSEWSPEFFINKAKEIDPVVELYITEVLKKKQHPEQAYKSCQGILMLGRKVGIKRLIKACSRAHAIGYYNYRIIDDILKKNLDNYQEEPQHSPMPAHDNIRGSDYYQ